MAANGGSGSTGERTTSSGVFNNPFSKLLVRATESQNDTLVVSHPPTPRAAVEALGAAVGARAAPADEAPPLVATDEQDKPVAPTPAQAPYGFSFTPGGLLMPYQLGIVAALIDAGHLDETVPIAGSSAGALTTIVVGAGLDLREVMAETEVLCADLRAGGTRGRLASVLGASLRRMLPEDVAERLNARAAPAGVVFTALQPLPVGHIATRYADRDDVVEVLLASCHVPFWLDGMPVTRARGKVAVDGFFSTPSKCFGAPTLAPYARRTIRISVFPGSVVSVAADEPGALISPDLLGEGRFPRDFLSFALNPASTEGLVNLFDLGRETAEIWLERHSHLLSGLDIEEEASLAAETEAATMEMEAAATETAAAAEAAETEGDAMAEAADSGAGATAAQVAQEETELHL